MSPSPGGVVRAILRAFLPVLGEGCSIFKMIEQSRHCSVETLRGYVRDAEIFKEHAGAGLL